VNARPPVPADGPAVAALLAETLGGARDPLDVARRHAATTRLVIDDGRDPIGWIEYRIIGDEAELLEIAVAPRARRRGVATGLMTHMIEAGRAAGVVAIHLEVRADNAGACALYAHHGFEISGRRRRYYADGEDAITCCLTIERGAR